MVLVVKTGAGKERAEFNSNCNMECEITLRLVRQRMFGYGRQFVSLMKLI